MGKKIFSKFGLNAGFSFQIAGKLLVKQNGILTFKVGSANMAPESQSVSEKEEDNH